MNNIELLSFTPLFARGSTQQVWFVGFWSWHNPQGDGTTCYGATKLMNNLTFSLRESLWVFSSLRQRHRRGHVYLRATIISLVKVWTGLFVQRIITWRSLIKSFSLIGCHNFTVWFNTWLQQEAVCRQKSSETHNAQHHYRSKSWADS